MSEKILIVDDEATNLHVLYGILRPFYPVVAATSGAAALELVRDSPPDLILLDVMMPGMDGYQVCRLLKQDPVTQAIPVIFVTALTSTADEVHGFELGAADYMTKPVRPAVVLARIRNHLELRRHRERLSTEREMIERVILRMHQVPDFESTRMQTLIKPAEKTTGDLLCSAVTPQGVRHLLLGDLTGHGLVAAIGGPMVTDIFYSMSRKGCPMTDILAEINRKVHSRMATGMFLAATAVSCSADGTEGLQLWNFGLPDALLLMEDRPPVRFPSLHPPLGIVDPLQLATVGQDFAAVSGSTLFLYSDGLIEISNASGTWLGETLLCDWLQRMMTDGLDLEWFNTVLEEFHAGVQQVDDLTLVRFNL
ncbi:MAG: response regulator [Magnetococcales bacterium]|nr:response regulator [Magnetococcales bacterium]